MKKFFFISLTCLSSVLSANAAVTYKLTVTNGSAMPLSPSVVYTTNSSSTDRAIGDKASESFVRICRDGDAKFRDAELAKLPSVVGHQVVDGMIQPGESRTIMVKVKNPHREAIQFETMYGKTRDICGVFTIPARDLLEGKKPAGKDQVVRTGAYLPPFLPADTGNICREGNAVTCLRSLSPATTGTVHFFRPYLPSVISFLDERFGSEETDTLLIPTGGAISYTLQKH